MKKLITILLILAGFGTIAQNYPSPIIARPNNSYGGAVNRSIIDSTLYFPTACGVPTDTTWLFSQGTNPLFPGFGQKMRMAAMYYDSCGHHEYVWDPSLQAWHVTDAGGGSGSGFSIRMLTSSNFFSSASCALPQLNNDSLQIFWNDLGRFLVEGTEWQELTGGGFVILIPGFDATANSYQLTLYANNISSPPGPQPFTSSSFSGSTICPVVAFNGMTLQIFWNDAQRYLVQGTDFTPLSGGGFTIIIPGFDATTTNYSFYVFAQ